MRQYQEHACAPVRSDAFHRESPGFEHELAARGFSFAPLKLLQQIRHIFRDDFNHVLRERVVGRQTRRAPHGAFCPHGIAAAQLRQGANVRNGIIDCFALAGRAGRNLLRALRLLIVVRISRRSCRRRTRLSTDRNRRRSAEIGRGSHCCEVARVKNVRSRARGPRTARRHIRYDRDWRGEEWP